MLAENTVKTIFYVSRNHNANKSLSNIVQNIEQRVLKIGRKRNANNCYC